MAVPTRPAGGATIDSAWGQVAHDTAVAQDIQSGVVTVAMPNAAAGFTQVTFPRPFASAPSVVASINSAQGGTTAYTARAVNITATGFSCYVYSATGANATVSSPVSWLAYGPRA